VLKAVEPDEAYSWGLHSGPELDLLLLKDGRRIGVEIKRADAPKLEPSMRAALEILKLDRLLVLYPGSVRYSLSDRAAAVPLQTVARPTRLLG
jgi:predicted AAA+ superfamily ATPase